MSEKYDIQPKTEESAGQAEKLNPALIEMTEKLIGEVETFIEQNESKTPEELHAFAEFTDKQLAEMKALTGHSTREIQISNRNINHLRNLIGYIGKSSDEKEREGLLSRVLYWLYDIIGKDFDKMQIPLLNELEK